MVDQEMVDYFLEVLPPAYWSSSIVQMGEPYDHAEEGATYATLQRTPEGWAYAGHCYRGKTEHIIGYSEMVRLSPRRKGTV